MNIVTKSGTNQMRGSWFTNLRDKDLNAKTMTEKINNVDKQPYRRYQYGGSFGGPIVQNRAHFFAAYERTQQDTTAVGERRSVCSRTRTASSRRRAARTCSPARCRRNLTPSQYRVGALRPQHQLAGLQRGDARGARELGRQRQQVQLDQPEPQLGAGRLEAERVRLPVRRLREPHRLRAPTRRSRRSRTASASATTPTRRRRPSSTSSSSATTSPGTSRGWAASATTSRPAPTSSTSRSLFVTFSSGSADYAYTHLDNDLNGPISRVTRNKPGASANLPMDQYGFYIQDDWRVTDRLTVNAGLRYDLVTGFLIDQSAIPELRRADRRGGRRPLQRRARLRRVRQEGPGGQEQLAAAHRRRLRPARRRQATSSAPAGASTTTTATPTPTSCSRA